MKLLADQDVMVVRDGRPERARLRAWLDGYDGPVPTYRIELRTRYGSYTCPYTATGPDLFETLVRLRRQLEPDGWMVAVQGSRRDTYPSGTARDADGGERIHVLCPGRHAHADDLVATLADAQPDLLATVTEQHAFFETWLAEPKQP